MAIAPTGADPGWMRRWRGLLALSAAIGAVTFLGGLAGAVAAPVAAVGTWIAVGRVEPAGARRTREQVARELPHLVRLLGVALASGAPPATALEVVADALPGAASDRLRPVASRLRLGADPAAGWAALRSDPALAPLGRALGRAEEGGVPVAEAIARLADDLAQQARGEVERRARAVGVRAAVPLGLCLLPAFLLIGIVPLVGGLLSSLSW
jgi:Flp pilus assembly protein TadB